MNCAIRSLSLGLLLGSAALAGCAGRLSPEAKQLLQQGYDFYGSGNDVSAIQSLDAFLQENAKSSRADEAYYLRGMARYRRKDLPGAKTDLIAAIDRTGNKQLRANASLALADIAYEQDDMALAENLYRQVLGDLQDGKKPADHAYYRLGCVLQRQGRWQDADQQFDRLIYLFGDSDLARQASRRIRSTAWTIQAGAFQSKDRADQEAERLRAKQLPVSSKSILFDGRPLFVVHVGQFATYEQASAALPNTKGHCPNAFVTTTR